MTYFGGILNRIRKKKNTHIKKPIHHDEASNNKRRQDAITLLKCGINVIETTFKMISTNTLKSCVVFYNKI